MLPNWVQVTLILGVSLQLAASVKPKTKPSLVEEILDNKDFKKLLKTKNNVLVTFHDPSRGTGASELFQILREVSEKVKGLGTLASVDCSDKEGKKLCKKLKVSIPPKDSFYLKHYKDGNFHKDYDRKLTVSSMATFMKDPTADLPWEEDEGSVDVVHITDAQHFQKFLKREKGKVLVMFYAPWCGFCKRMKPDYQLAATEVKDIAKMVALNVDKPENAGISKRFNITGFPTLIYFENGEQQYLYPGENNKNSLVAFLKNPTPGSTEKKAEEAPWSEEPSEVAHLTAATFDNFVAENPSVMVMFYAPWCGHCKKMKPHFTSAAEKLKNEKVVGKLAAVDCTIERGLAEKFGVKGYPTVKYFKDGELAFDAGHAREEKSILEFMRDPKEPPPPPPPEQPWSEEASDVVHLTDDTFKTFLKKKKHVLVMFYAPWCGHCKKAKPEFTEAAAEYHEDSKVEFAAVDCTVERGVCSSHEISGYPTFKYFKYFDKERKNYDGGRTKNDFVEFMKDPENPQSGQPPPVPTPEETWAEHEGAEFVKHLRNHEFPSFIKEKEHVLVLFYAPWCGHCKAMKGDYAGAAKWLSNDNKLSHAIAAVDATVETEISSKLFSISGYPTLKYFHKGKFVEDYNGGRRKMDFVEFLKKKASGEAKPKEEL